MSLLTLHRILIAVGILFCFGFAILQAGPALRGEGSALVPVTFLLLGTGLVVYLLRMRTFLGYGAQEGGDAG